MADIRTPISETSTRFIRLLRGDMPDRGACLQDGEDLHPLVDKAVHPVSRQAASGTFGGGAYQPLSQLSGQRAALRPRDAAQRSIQKLPGHSDVRTTEIYAHVLGRGAMGVISPLDG
jgi:integrase